MTACPMIEAGTEALPRLALRPAPEEIVGAVADAVRPYLRAQVRAQVLDEVIHALRDEGHCERAVWAVERMADPTFASSASPACASRNVDAPGYPSTFPHGWDGGMSTHGEPTDHASRQTATSGESGA